MHHAFALVGPGRAGTTVALALRSRGWTARAVAGRSPGAPSVVAVASRLHATPATVADAGRNARLVIVATPDAAIADAAAALAPGLRSDALVLHLSGACTLAELDKVRLARPDVDVGSLHPLQSLPPAELGVARLPGSWCAVEGPASVERLAISLGMRPFRVDPALRAAYHAAATVASNHLVALLGQAIRLAEAAGVPPGALVPLVRSTLENVETVGPAAALTGPVSRGDAETVARHLDVLPRAERPAYRALAERALELSGRDHASLRALLEDAP